MCSDNQHAFILFAFDFLASEAVDLLHRVQMVMHINVMTRKSMNIMFTTIDFVIKKVVVQLIAALPSIHW